MASDSSGTCKGYINQINAGRAVIDSVKSKLASIDAQVNSALAGNPTMEQLDALYNQKAALNREMARVNTSGILFNAKSDECQQATAEAESLVSYARSVYSAISATSAKITNAEDALEAKQKAEAEAKDASAAQEAASKSNNQGTGTPGTAGQGPEAKASDLEEVAVTGKKTPAPIPAASGAGDGLDEVTVTGKKVPEPIANPTGASGATGPTETLEEVAVTGRRNTNTAIPPKVKQSQAQATLQDTTNFKQRKDWRFRMSLSPGATYLYKDPNNKLLAPLSGTDGIIFPYTPSVSITYAANYEGILPTHSNYKYFSYQNSSVDNITITCDFTAQDTYEANYLLAVIHFLRSATKMFYGQDELPKPGTPPPLCYLFGFGQYQFNAHPVVINNFTYTLPTDVDYIRAGQITKAPGESRADEQPKPASKAKGWGEIAQEAIQNRLNSGIAKIGKTIGLSLTPGGGTGGPVFGGDSGFNSQIPPGTEEPTYVPTKINISFSCYPVVSRYEISSNFSLKDYANGNLLLGTKRKGGGFW